MDNRYTGLAASLHDAFWAAEGQPAELPLLDSFLRRHPGRALEIGCGSGRLLLPLLARGHPLAGLDASAEMLALCRAAAAPLGLDPVLHQGDMETFSPGEPFHALTVPAFTLQLAADPAAALANFRRQLAPGGGLYLTVFLPLAEIAGELPEHEWYPDLAAPLPEGNRATITSRHTLDLPRRVLHRQHRHEIRDTAGNLVARHESRQTLRWFDAPELAALLTSAGFHIDRAFGEFDPDFPADDAQILTFEATLKSA